MLCSYQDSYLGAVMSFYEELETAVQDECSDYIHRGLARLWLVRGIQLLSQQQRREILTGISEPEATIREALGVSRCVGDDIQFTGGTTFDALLADLAVQRQFEQGILFDNLRMLGRRIGLTPVELRVLAFRVAFRLDSGLATLMDKMFPGWTDVSLYHRLARILGESESSIEQALSPKGKRLRRLPLNTAPIRCCRPWVSCVRSCVLRLRTRFRARPP
jgi:hypothetical protein